jgi:hypothetical protein
VRWAHKEGVVFCALMSCNITCFFFSFALTIALAPEPPFETSVARVLCKRYEKVSGEQRAKTHQYQDAKGPEVRFCQMVLAVLFEQIFRKI